VDRGIGVTPTQSVASATPALPPAPIGPDTQPPGLTIRSRTHATLTRVLRKGVTLTITCSEACTLRAKLQLPPLTARRLKLQKVLGTGRARLGVAGSQRVVLRIVTKARKRLRDASMRRLRFLLSVTATDAARNRAEKTLNITVRR